MRIIGIDSHTAPQSQQWPHRQNQIVLVQSATTNGVSSKEADLRRTVTNSSAQRIRYVTQLTTQQIKKEIITLIEEDKRIQGQIVVKRKGQVVVGKTVQAQSQWLRCTCGQTIRPIVVKDEGESAIRYVERVH